MAEKDKKFYWLKLKTEFMNGEVVDFLMSQKNGANYVVLYEMLAIKTMNTNGRLCSEIGECLIPFDPEKIQRECKWFDIDTIRVAMELYCKLGLIYKDKENVLQIANFDEMIGNETYWAKQKRLQREAGIGHALDNVQKPLISNIYNLDSNTISLEEDKVIKENKEVKHKYGKYSNVLLKDSEVNSLVKKYGKEKAEAIIEYCSERFEMKKYKYNSHYLAILKWVARAYEEDMEHKPTGKQSESLLDMASRIDSIIDEIK